MSSLKQASPRNKQRKNQHVIQAEPNMRHTALDLDIKVWGMVRIGACIPWAGVAIILAITGHDRVALVPTVVCAIWNWWKK